MGVGARDRDLVAVADRRDRIDGRVRRGDRVDVDRLRGAEEKLPATSRTRVSSVCVPLPVTEATSTPGVPTFSGPPSTRQRTECTPETESGAVQQDGIRGRAPASRGDRRREVARATWRRGGSSARPRRCSARRGLPTRVSSVCSPLPATSSRCEVATFRCRPRRRASTRRARSPECASVPPMVTLSAASGSQPVAAVVVSVGRDGVDADELRVPAGGIAEAVGQARLELVDAVAADRDRHRAGARRRRRSSCRRAPTRPARRRSRRYRRR